MYFRMAISTLNCKVDNRNLLNAIWRCDSDLCFRLSFMSQILSGLYFNTSIISSFDLVGVFELFQTGFRYSHFLGSFGTGLDLFIR